MRSAGMVHATVSGSVAPSGTKQLYEVRPPDRTCEMRQISGALPTACMGMGLAGCMATSLRTAEGASHGHANPWAWPSLLRVDKMTL